MDTIAPDARTMASAVGPENGRMLPTSPSRE
jgi:hypothetical protein